MTSKWNYLAACALLFVALVPFGKAQQVGDEVCIEGYVMDRYCIELGRLLDNSRIATLEGPEQHSVHCLVDVGVCSRSVFEILTKPGPDETLYNRGWQVNDDGKTTLINLARRIGRCSTCTGDGNLRAGFHVGMIATVEARASGSEPATVSIMDVEATREDEDFCGAVAATVEPTPDPTPRPRTTSKPTAEPTFRITSPPTRDSTTLPTHEPTTTPTAEPSGSPTEAESTNPAQSPSFTPSVLPSPEPSASPEISPSVEPSKIPSVISSAVPSTLISNAPVADSMTPSLSLSTAPSTVSSVAPSLDPTVGAVDETGSPTVRPTVESSLRPSQGLVSGATTATTPWWKVTLTLGLLIVATFAGLPG